jgi:hypothetical protein
MRLCAVSATRFVGVFELHVPIAQHKHTCIALKKVTMRSGCTRLNPTPQPQCGVDSENPRQVQEFLLSASKRRGTQPVQGRASLRETRQGRRRGRENQVHRRVRSVSCVLWDSMWIELSIEARSRGLIRRKGPLQFKKCAVQKTTSFCTDISRLSNSPLLHNIIHTICRFLFTYLHQQSPYRVAPRKQRRRLYYRASNSRVIVQVACTTQLIKFT